MFAHHTLRWELKQISRVSSGDALNAKPSENSITYFHERTSILLSSASWAQLLLVCNTSVMPLRRFSQIVLQLQQRGLLAEWANRAPRRILLTLPLTGSGCHIDVTRVGMLAWGCLIMSNYSCIWCMRAWECVCLWSRSFFTFVCLRDHSGGFGCLAPSPAKSGVL